MTYLDEYQKAHPELTREQCVQHAKSHCPDRVNCLWFTDGEEFNMEPCVKCWNRPVNRKEKEDISHAQT